MNYILHTFLSLLLISNAGSFITAMDREIIPAKDMSNTMVMRGIQELPQELKLYIISLWLQHNPGYRFSLLEKLPIGYRINSIAHSPHEKTIIIGTSNQAFLWDIEKMKQIRALRGPGHISSVAFSTQGKNVIVGYQDNSAHVYNCESGHLIKKITKYRKPVRLITFSLDEETVFTGLLDNVGHLWDSKTKELVRTFKVDTSNTVCIACSPKGETVLTGLDNKTACLWSTKTGELLKTLPEHRVGITAAAFSPDGKMIATSSGDKTVFLWNSQTGELVTTFKNHTSLISSIEFSPDGKTVITGSWDRHVCLCKLSWGFEDLTNEQKNDCFKQFMAYYPLLMHKTDSTKNPTTTSAVGE